MLVARRGFVGLGAALAMPAATGRAQEDMLAQLRRQGVVRIGLANQPPYSGLNPDGTISGFVPVLVQRVMAALGVPRVEGVVATYGELVPGMQAGRWQMIGASFRLTRERCAQVLFTDPVTFDGGAIAHVPGSLPAVPRDLAEVASRRLTVGILQGSYLARMVQERGVDRAQVSQFPSNPALIDGLLTRRVQVAVSTNASLAELRKQRNDRFDIVFPLADDPPVGSAPAFRRQDAALHAAFQQQLRAMRASGELQRLASEYGFGEPPPALQGITIDAACANVSA
jgi:polar amino acid transport system substrate-binding protein